MSREEETLPVGEHKKRKHHEIPQGEDRDAKRERKEKKKQKRRDEAESKQQKNEEAPPSAEDVEGSESKASSGANGESERAKAERKAAKKEAKRLKKLTKEREAGEDEDTVTSVGQSEAGQYGRYKELDSLKAVPAEQMAEFTKTHSITVTDPQAKDYRPIINFEHLPAQQKCEKAMFAGFKAPTPIQAAAWPFLLAGRDVVGIAETGSGKTLAFGLPCIRAVSSKQAQSDRKSPIQAVIVSPTRELALQIHEQLSKLVQGTQTTVTCIYGGVPKDDQRTSLRKSQIIVATPGRLNDFIQEGAADLSNVSYLVLDEADRMLDKGFEAEIRKIASQTQSTPHCQTLMFTATWPTSIRELASTFLQDPVKIAIGEPTSDLRANMRVTQKVEVVDPRSKETRLLQLLKQHCQNDAKMLVFCLYKKEATRIENFIRVKGFRVAGIHGDMSQVARTSSLEAFKTGKVRLLVATDVAARGLDIPAVKVVLNVTFPLTAEDYVHRIGRTGRAGQTGLAITLFTEHDKAQSGALINVLKAAKQEVPAELLKFGTTVKKKAHEQYGAFYREPTDKKATKITFD